MADALDRESGREERGEQDAGALVDAASRVERAVHAFVQQREDRVVGEREHEGGGGDRASSAARGWQARGRRSRPRWRRRAIAMLSRDGIASVASGASVAGEIRHRRLRHPVSMLVLVAAVPAHERRDHAGRRAATGAAQAPRRRTRPERAPIMAPRPTRGGAMSTRYVPSASMRPMCPTRPAPHADHGAALHDDQRAVERERARRPVDQRAHPAAPQENPQRVEARHQPQHLLEPGQPVEHDLPLIGEPPDLVGAGVLRQPAAVRPAEDEQRRAADERRQRERARQRPHDDGGRRGRLRVRRTRRRRGAARAADS